MRKTEHKGERKENQWSFLVEIIVSLRVGSHFPLTWERENVGYVARVLGRGYGMRQYVSSNRISLFLLSEVGCISTCLQRGED